jgi:hypothetical protein
MPSNNASSSLNPTPRWLYCEPVPFSLSCYLEWSLFHAPLDLPSELAIPQVLHFVVPLEDCGDGATSGFLPVWPVLFDLNDEFVPHHGQKCFRSLRGLLYPSRETSQSCRRKNAVQSSGVLGEPRHSRRSRWRSAHHWPHVQISSLVLYLPEIRLVCVLWYRSGIQETLRTQSFA